MFYHLWQKMQKTYWNCQESNLYCRAPFAPVFRNFAVVAVKGTSVLPKNCLSLAGGAFGVAIILDLVREYLSYRLSPDSRWTKLIPIPSMMGIPTFIGYDHDTSSRVVILTVRQSISRRPNMTPYNNFAIITFHLVLLVF